MELRSASQIHALINAILAWKLQNKKESISWFSRNIKKQ